VGERHTANQGGTSEQDRQKEKISETTVEREGGSAGQITFKETADMPTVAILKPPLCRLTSSIDNKKRRKGKSRRKP